MESIKSDANAPIRGLRNDEQPSGFFDPPRPVVHQVHMERVCFVGPWEYNAFVMKGNELHIQDCVIIACKDAAAMTWRQRIKVLWLLVKGF